MHEGAITQSLIMLAVRRSTCRSRKRFNCNTCD
jgi:hypothetical protein